MAEKITIEEKLIATVLSDTTGEYGRLFAENLVPSDFMYNPVCADAIIKTVHKGKNASFSFIESDYPNLTESLSKMRGLSCDINDGIERVKSSSRFRKMREATNILSTHPYDYDSMLQVMDKYEASITEALKYGFTKTNSFRVQDGLSWYFDELAKQIQENKTGGIPSGFSKFDEITGEMRPGELWVVAGRPGSGKTSYAMSIFCWQLLNAYKPAFYSLEISKREMYDKLFSIMSDILDKIVPYQSLRNPHGQKTILNNLMEFTTKLLQTQGTFCVDPCATYGSVCSSIRDLKRKGQIEIAFIDQLTLFIQNHNKSREELSHYTRGFKKLAGELEIPIVLLTQLSRETETKGLPGMSHLKGSGTIEEDADAVIFPFRPCLMDDKISKEEAMLIFGKGRNADGQNIMLNFSTVTTRFKETSNAKSF